MTDATTELKEFYNYIWGAESPSANPTFVYLPVEHEGKWTPFMFEWPRQREGVVRHTLKWSAIKANVFYSPAVFKAANPAKENVLGSWVLWVDFDGNAPDDWLEEPEEGKIFIPPPTLIVQSSIEKHEHCYWKLEKFVDDIETLEDRNRALAYVMHADTSGWDADQILRPIRTTNHKRNMPVIVKEWEREDEV
tara:strand:+ start:28 stop:606 length:579 start_codon:yes stop_codon:yes gene_type:complete